MSVYLNYLADELADIVERLAEPDLAPFTQRLRATLSEAFVQACAAEQAARLSPPREEAA